ncbi:DUF2797 domain-containing protein [Streptomyces sp. T-3]|nr:DUF2797 domain-containing protein [Streptomyces sp. T-3]
MTWWCTGLRWDDGRPALGWYGEAGRGERARVLSYGTGLAFRAEGERRCLGVWRGGRRTPCPVAAVVPARGTRAQCAECARIDRQYSVAADTTGDDPRPYAVYLAWFGPGLVKVGITREERGPARLYEQGAVAFAWLGRGPLMAARRAEELLGAALKVPDRIPYAKKRRVRAGLGSSAERVAELRACHERAVGLTGWPEALVRAPFEVVDHAGEFGLAGLRGTTAGVRELVPGGVVAGRLLAAAGPDLHLAPVGGGELVVDTRLMSGWALSAAEPGAEVSVPVVDLSAVQGGLF